MNIRHLMTKGNIDFKIETDSSDSDKKGTGQPYTMVTY